MSLTHVNLQNVEKSAIMTINQCLSLQKKRENCVLQLQVLYSYSDGTRFQV